MFDWFGRFLSSSIGKKTVMAVTGLALVGFLITHLAGNLTLYSGGGAFNDYAEKLESYGILLHAAEFVLLGLFLVHVGFAMRINHQNAQARPQRYEVRGSMGNKTVASRSMAVTGLILLVFLIIHVIDFRLPTLAGEVDDLAAAVRERLGTPTGALIYLIGVAALGLHLRHAIQSAFQTLGWAHPHWTPLLRGVGVGLAAALAVGFASFPVYCYLTAASGRS